MAIMVTFVQPQVNMSVVLDTIMIRIANSGGPITRAKFLFALFSCSRFRVYTSKQSVREFRRP